MKKLFSLLLSLLLLSGCLSRNFDNGQLYIFMPGEYISEEIVEQFEYEHGIEVKITTFASNEEMYTKLLGETGLEQGIEDLQEIIINYKKESELKYLICNSFMKVY